jgi:ribosomal protein L28
MPSTMKVCMRCEKGVQVANTRSHSNIASKRKQRPNLQRLTVGGKRMVLCASCVKVATRDIAR